MTGPMTYGTVTYNYDNRDLLTTQTWQGGTHTRTYDNLGWIITLSRPNGATTTQTYDAAGQLTELRTAVGATERDRHRYTYDAAGNILTWTLGASNVQTYTYDVLNRVVSDTMVTPGADNEKSHTFAYDAVGNLTGKSTTLTAGTTSTTGYTVNSADRVITVTVNGTPRTITYDANGNMLNNGAGRTHTWNARNQLASTGGNLTRAFTYDVLGRRRTVKVNSAAPVVQGYDGLNLVQIGTNNVLQGEGIDTPLQLRVGTTDSFYVTDHLGSTRKLLTSTGTQANSYTYGTYGKLTTTGGNNPNGNNPFTYTAREEVGGGLIYFRNRYYDSLIERLTQMIPWGWAEC